MFKPNKIALTVALLSGVLLAGCNSGSSSSSGSTPPPAGGGNGGGSGGGGTGGGTTPPPAMLQGRFVDIENIDALIEEVRSTTGAGGTFNYVEEGDNVLFSIGDIALPPVSAAPVVTPLDMSEDGTYDNTVVNVMRLLETLDSDPATPGIQINEAAKTAAATYTFDFDAEPAAFASSDDMTNYLSALGLSELASTAAATESLHCILAEAGVSATQPVVGAQIVREDDGELGAVLVFARDGRFYMGQYIAEPEFDGDTGFEIGTYAQLGDQIRFSITEDTNISAGVLSPFSPPDRCSGSEPASNVLTILSTTPTTITYEVQEEDGPFVFSGQRVDKSQGQMAGAWLEDDGQAVLIFEGTDVGGNYYIFNFEEGADDDVRGVEAGTYTRSGNVVTPTVLLDFDGDAGLSDIGGSFLISIDGEQMTLTVEEPDGVFDYGFSRID